MKRKIVATTLTMVGIFIIILSILLFLGFFESQKAGILIESEPVAEVYINNKKVGITPYETEIIPSEIIVKIKPNAGNGIVLDDYETKVNLVSGIKTIIKRNFNENEEISSGSEVSFEEVGKSESIVTVVSVPDNSQVLIDGKLYGYTPFKVNIPAGEHILLITSENYLDNKLSIIVYKGYKLTAFVKLAKIILPEPSPASVLPAVTEIKKQIKINKTDIGFLRVRSGAGIGFPEVAQVKPDEVYDVLEEGENGTWYKIQTGEIQGWVSAEFASRVNP